MTPPRVVVVGVGPADPDQLTLRARDVIAGAALVVAEAALLALARSVVGPHAVVVTEAPSSWPQDGHSAWLVAGAGVASELVARLTRGGAVVDVVAGLDGAASAVVDATLVEPRRVRPLAGLTVVVTRAAEQAGELSTALRRRGADVVELPTIVIGPPADDGRALAEALDHVERYQWVVVTSANGARRLLDLVPDGRRLAGVGLAAIGPATAAVLRAAHLPPDVVPGRYIAEGLLEAFPTAPADGSGRVLIARAAVARDALPDGLVAAGWQVDVVEAYRTGVAGAPDVGVRAAVAGADVVCFTAPSTFERFLALAGAGAVAPVVACIGPVTGDAVRAAGFEVTVEAAVHTVAGLVDALVSWARTRP